MAAIIDHIDRILMFPLIGRAHDDVRPGMRSTTFKKKTLVAYSLDESSDELGAHILGAFHHGGTGMPCSAQTRRVGGRLMTHPCVANAWQEDRRRPFVANALQRVSAGQAHNADYCQQRPLSVPSFPWYY